MFPRDCARINRLAWHNELKGFELKGKFNALFTDYVRDTE